MSKCAFPPWLPHNSHTSVTLIKMKLFFHSSYCISFLFTLSLLPLHLLLTHRYMHPQLSLPPSRFPLSRRSIMCRSPSKAHLSCVIHQHAPHWWQNAAWENEREHKAAACSLALDPVMVYIHSVSRYLAITPGSHKPGHCYSICYTDKEANEAALQCSVTPSDKYERGLK